jgi:hypothetical protein
MFYGFVLWSDNLSFPLSRQGGPPTPLHAVPPETKGWGGFPNPLLSRRTDPPPTEWSGSSAGPAAPVAEVRPRYRLDGRPTVSPSSPTVSSRTAPLPLGEPPPFVSGLSNHPASTQRTRLASSRLTRRHTVPSAAHLSGRSGNSVATGAMPTASLETLVFHRPLGPISSRPRAQTTDYPV